MFDYALIEARIPRLDEESPDEELSVKAQARRLGCADGTIRRYQAEGMNPYQADRLCVEGLGLHPAGVFGFDAWVYADDVAKDENGRVLGGEVEAEKFRRQKRSA